MSKPEECIYYNCYNGFLCDINVKETGFRKKYNCKKNGVCFWFKSIEEHQKQVEQRKEERDLREYKRLKDKYEE